VRSTILQREFWRRLAARADQQDFLAAGIVAVAILMFFGVGVRVVPAAFHALLESDGRLDQIASTALILNVALVLFSWRRYKDAAAERAKRAEAEQKVEVLSSRDQLTNLLMLRSIIETGNRAIREAHGVGHRMAVLVINLDRFKNINDICGHIAGDTVLRSVADAIGKAIPADALCARIAADEFAALVPFGDGGSDGVSDVAGRIVERLGDPLEIGGIHVHSSVSIGLSGSSPECSDIEGLMRRANIAMRVAKTSGGGRELWFDSSMESVLKARNEVESGIRRGIPLGEFQPYYQPVIDLVSGEIAGLEALARWNHPAGGVANPDLFIPVAEEAGLIGELFESILHQALEEACDWDPRLILSVNVSPGQLKDPWLAHRILKVLSEVNFPAERLEVEITESSLFENLAVARSIVESLKDQGVRLALDDFGTGYSSLAHLRALPFDRIKVDRSFVQAMSKDPGSLAIVTAVVSMAGGLGVPVTAEGVEDAEAAVTLRELGCDKAQGWIYGRPLAGDETHRLLHSKGLLRQTPSGGSPKSASDGEDGVSRAA
jgi:diguanylate cyclase (GGDEF)-like protein